MEKMMKTARMHKIGEFSVESVPVPVPHGDELLVRIGACGVCGSDMPRIYVNGTSKQKYPLTLGHEFSGTVVAVGETADPTFIGKRGTFFPLIPCRKCDSCLSGNYAMCEDYAASGDPAAAHAVQNSLFNFQSSPQPIFCNNGESMR